LPHFYAKMREKSASSISPFPAWIASMNLHESAHWKFLQNHKLLQVWMEGTKLSSVFYFTSTKPETKASQGRKCLNSETKITFSFCTKPQYPSLETVLFESDENITDSIIQHSIMLRTQTSNHWLNWNNNSIAITS